MRATSGMLTARNALKNMARPEGFEPPTYGFVVLRGRIAGIARGAAKIAAPPYFMRPSARFAIIVSLRPTAPICTGLGTWWARSDVLIAGARGGKRR